MASAGSAVRLYVELLGWRIDVEAGRVSEDSGELDPPQDDPPTVVGGYLQGAEWTSTSLGFAPPSVEE
jgi:hypothetical protein